MQRFVLIAGLVALFMYAGFATAGTRVVAPTSEVGLAGLEQALSATGADLRSVQISGWVRVTQPAAARGLAAAMGWQTQPPLRDEARDAEPYKRDGETYVGVRWLIPYAGVTNWQAKAARVQAALAAAGPEPVMTVQLAGTTSRVDVLPLANQALDRLKAGARQPWSDGIAASIAAQSKALPPGPFGVNLQVAARRDGTGGRTRVWVAWPALQQDY